MPPPLRPRRLDGQRRRRGPPVYAQMYLRLASAGVRFVRPPRSESYGRVAVFQDIAGNSWDLLGPA